MNEGKNKEETNEKKKDSIKNYCSSRCHFEGSLAVQRKTKKKKNNKNARRLIIQEALS